MERAVKFEWSQEDRYMSNDGRGPVMARILCVDGKIVTLEKWNSKSQKPRNETFRLSLKFFTSDRCGWSRLRS